MKDKRWEEIRASVFLFMYVCMGVCVFVCVCVCMCVDGEVVQSI